MFRCPIIMMGKSACLQEGCQWWLPDYKDCNQNVIARASITMARGLQQAVDLAKEAESK